MQLDVAAFTSRSKMSLLEFWQQSRTGLLILPGKLVRCYLASEPSCFVEVS